MQLFTGLDCSCFRQIYCTSLLVDVSSFPAEKSKKRKASLQPSSIGKAEGCNEGWSYATVQWLMPFQVFAWLWLVGLEGLQGKGCLFMALWAEQGCCEELSQREKGGNRAGSFGSGLLLGGSRAHSTWSAPRRGSQSIPFACSSNYTAPCRRGVSSCWK